MNASIQGLYQDTKSVDDQIRLKAFTGLLAMSEHPVDWVYEIWDDLISRLKDPNSYQRTIALMLLCNLVKSDSQCRIRHILPEILSHTKDEKFITSRQCIQTVWKIAIYQPVLRDEVVQHLAKRFTECANEKHANLLRLDMIQSLRKIDREGDLKDLIESLITSETDEKYRVSYRKK
jgi:hypothetical protein